jgi:hypothetical protein
VVVPRPIADGNVKLPFDIVVTHLRWRLQLHRSFLGTAQRVSDGLLGGGRHRLNYFHRKPRWVCRTVHDRGGRYENGKPLCRPGDSGDSVIHISDTRLAAAKQSTTPSNALIARE